MDDIQDAAPSSTEPEFVAPGNAQPVSTGDTETSTGIVNSSNDLSTASDVSVANSGSLTTGVEGSDAALKAAYAEFAASQAEWKGNVVAALTGASSLDAAVSADHPAHALVDQIGEHMAALEGSGDSLMARIAAEVKRLVGEIKAAL